MAATQAFPASLPPHYAQEVCQQWERFVSGQLLDVETVRPVVRDSWLRCRETGLNPFHPPLAPAVSEEELESLRTAAVLPVHDSQSTRPIGYVLTFPFPQAPRTRPRVAPAPAGIPGEWRLNCLATRPVPLPARGETGNAASWRWRRGAHCFSTKWATCR